MNKTLSILTTVVIGALLLSACAQQALNQQPTGQPTGQSAQLPASMGTGEGTVVPGVVSQPLTQIAPQTPTPADVATNGDGQKIITRDAKGQTFTMVVGESILVQLGDQYTWEITISDDSVLSRVKNIAVIRGAQGVYEAKKAGTVTVSAAGDPLCRQSKPACGMPSILLDFTVIVK